MNIPIHHRQVYGCKCMDTDGLLCVVRCYCILPCKHAAVGIANGYIRRQPRRQEKVFPPILFIRFYIMPRNGFIIDT